MGMSRSYKVLQRWLGLHRDLNSLAVANSTRNYHPPPSIKSDFQGLVVDLRSDTLTCPSLGMKEAMMNALLGDDVYREDPTCKEFERRMSEYTGKEAALFVASGTMGNLISVLVHCGSRGSEVLLGDQSHLFLYEQAGMAQLGGVQSHIISNKPDGTFDIADVLSRVRGDDVHCPVTELICIENTHNVCGGKILPRQWIDELGDAVHGLDLPLHMDGARLINAAVASRESPATILNNCDTASICLSKGLGTPVGSVIVGSEEFINKALRLRKALGGGMRQVGMLAAAALYALDHNVDRLADDHKHARLLAQAVSSLGSRYMTTVIEDVHTNIFLVGLDTDVISPEDFCKRLAMVSDAEMSSVGEAIIIKCMPWSNKEVRFVTHHDIGIEQIEAAIAKIKFVISEVDSHGPQQLTVANM